MSKLIYKLNIIISKIKYKISNNKKFSKILKSKITFFIISIIFIIFLGTYLYIVINNNQHGFQRYFDSHFFKWNNIKNKLLYGSVITGIILITYLINIFGKYFHKLKLIFNKYLIGSLIYLIVIYFLVDSLKYQILSIITPLVLYFNYKIYLYIQETKERYKFKFLFDSRYLFLIALILLIYTPLYLYFEDKKLAEQLSIYAYYFLVGGVVYEIISSKFIK